MPPTLRVKFPKWPGWNISEFILYESTPSSPSSMSSSGSDDSDLPSPPLITVSVDSESDTDYGSDSPVFRGCMSLGSERRDRGQTSTKHQVVLKFALREDLVPDLVEEASMYDGTLRSLQGRVIPRCYGLYEGVGEEGQLIACLILERWGECLKSPFRSLALPLRDQTMTTYAESLRILQQLGEIHSRGLWHGDFAERNVLEKNGDIRIIDLDQIQHHECQSQVDLNRLPIVPGQKQPDVREFGCHQLWEICRSELRLWS